jgi:hypothetical protein
VLLLGGGDIGKLADRLLRRLEQRFGEKRS